MVQLTRIYTKGGDKGTTSLGTGKRVPKHDARVAAYGTVDEANAAIGLARLHAEGELDQMLSRIQNDLFDLGADLCLNPLALVYLNRLSDHLFVAARAANDWGKDDVLWQPGANR